MSDRDQKVQELAERIRIDVHLRRESLHASRLIDLEAKASECEAEHPPEPEYTTWCEAGKPDGQRSRDLESALIQAREALQRVMAECYIHWIGCGTSLGLTCNCSRREGDAAIASLSRLLKEE